jgi:hypothetical protein
LRIISSANHSPYRKACADDYTSTILIQGKAEDWNINKNSKITLHLAVNTFFDPHFSIGVEAQMNVRSSDNDSSRFGNPGGTNFNTGSAVTANIYFGK